MEVEDNLKSESELVISSIEPYGWKGNVYVNNRRRAGAWKDLTKVKMKPQKKNRI